MNNIEINPTSIIVGHWIIYIILISIFTILAKKSNSITPKPEISKGILIFVLVLLALTIFEIISFFIDTVGYFHNKKEYPRYEICEIKDASISRNIFNTKLLFTCKDGKKFIIDKWTLDLSIEVLTSGKRRRISSEEVPDGEKVFGKFTILPKTGIVIDVQKAE